MLPAPYDGTASYGKGAVHGPRAILEASGQLERYDEELDRCPDQAGVYTLPALELQGLKPAAVVEAVRGAARPPLEQGRFLLTLGGEHSVTTGVLQALLEVRGGRPFSVLQIDAHADLREEYLGTPFSHACVMARANELGLPLVQVGLRALSAEEREYMRSHALEDGVFWAHRILSAGRDERWMDEVLARLGDEVYVTFDLDGLDPSIMPATGTPVPGGLDWHTCLGLLRKTAARRVLAADVVELAPLPGMHAPDFLAARLAYKMLGYFLRQ